MAGEITHDKLGVALRRDSDSGYTEFGVVIGGKFIPFTARRNGDVDPELQEAKDAQQSESGESA